MALGRLVNLQLRDNLYHLELGSLIYGGEGVSMVGTIGLNTRKIFHEYNCCSSLVGYGVIRSRRYAYAEDLYKGIPLAIRGKIELCWRWCRTLYPANLFVSGLPVPSMDFLYVPLQCIDTIVTRVGFLWSTTFPTTSRFVKEVPIWAVHQIQNVQTKLNSKI